MRDPLRTRGFTFFELILVVGLIAIVAGMTVPWGVEMYNRQIARVVADDVFSSLKKAQSYARYRRGDDAFGVRFPGDDTFVVFKGTTWGSRDTDYDEVFDFQGVTATTTADEFGDPGTFIFTKGTGTTTATTTITISKGGVSQDISICPSGLIELGTDCELPEEEE